MSHSPDTTNEFPEGTADAPSPRSLISAISRQDLQRLLGSEIGDFPVTEKTED